MWLFSQHCQLKVPRSMTSLEQWTESITRSWVPNTLLHQSEATAVFMTLTCAVHPLGVGMSPWPSRQGALGKELVDWFITHQFSEPEPVRLSMRGSVFFFIMKWGLTCFLPSILHSGTRHFYSKVNLTQITSLFPPVRRLHVAPRVKPTSCNTIWNGPCSPFLCSCPTPHMLFDADLLTWNSLCAVLSLHIFLFVSPYNLYGFASSSFCLCFSYLNWMLFLPECFPWAPNLIKCFLYVSL